MHSVLSQSGDWPHREILGTRVDATSYSGAVRQVLGWAHSGQSRYVCVATVNEVMEAYDSPEFQRVMRAADLVTPDGMPLVWGLRLLGISGATRVYGPDLTPHLLGTAEEEGIPVGFYGGSRQVLKRLIEIVAERYPRLRVTYAFSPPFRPLGLEEDQRITDEINASGARLMFVALNSPKQNRWMWEHRGRVRAVMLGVGAAFDFLSGAKPQAPRWMMNVGLEWLFRLATEPRRLWKRYLMRNPRFVALFTLQLLGLRHFSPEARS